MIVTVLLWLLTWLAQVVSAPLSLIPLPAWATDGTISGWFATLKAYIGAGPAPLYLDLPFVFGVVNAWWSIRLGLIAVQWSMGIAARWLGPAVPRLRLDDAGDFHVQSDQGRIRERVAARSTRVGDS